MPKLDNKVALIIGATSGIGKAVVELFSLEGANVVFCGRRLDLGKKIEESLNEKGKEVMFIQCDVTKDEDIKKMVEDTIYKFGRIDILHNNAGVSLPSNIDEMDLNDNFDVTMDVNVKSYIRALKIVLPIMISQEGGVIINTSSIGGISAMPTHIAYTSSKAAILQITKSLAVEYAKYGIRVNSILPGLTDTEINQGNDAFVNEIVQQIPMGRIAIPEDIAKAVLFLASDDASFITGIDLVVDGGQTII